MIYIYCLLSYPAAYYFVRYINGTKYTLTTDKLLCGLTVIFAPVALPYYLSIVLFYLMFTAAERIGRFVTRD